MYGNDDLDAACEWEHDAEAEAALDEIEREAEGVPMPKRPKLAATRPPETRAPLASMVNSMQPGAGQPGAGQPGATASAPIDVHEIIDVDALPPSTAPAGASTWRKGHGDKSYHADSYDFFADDDADGAIDPLDEEDELRRIEGLPPLDRGALAADATKARRDEFKYDSAGYNEKYGSSGGGGSKAETTCFKCGQVGHWARECPTGGQGRGGNSGGGYNGGGYNGGGYNGGDNGGYNGSNRGGYKGGFMQNGSSVPKSGSGNRGGECYKCGQTGHWARDCPGVAGATKTSGGRGTYHTDFNGGGSKAYGGSYGGGGGGGNRSNECYKCGQLGHWASNCPNATRYR